MPKELLLSSWAYFTLWRVVVFAIGAIFMLIVALFAMPHDAQAAQTVPYKMNFQGRLANSAGNVMPDGLYNMRFRIFDASTAGTQQWTELRETTNRVQVTNGLFSVQLGDVTVLPLSIFTNQNLYFEIELPTPGTATCSTAACASFTEGPMTPRQKLASSAYAMNADTLDGIDGASVARVSVANSFTAAQTINVANAAALDVKNGATSLLIADTSNSVVKVGTTGTATLGTSVRLLSTSAEFSGTVRIGDATNGVEFSSTGITYRGTARPAKTVTMAPEYEGATFTGDGTSNSGSLSSDFCSSSSLLSINTTACGAATDEHNYYAWTTTAGTAQDYDLYIRYRIPSDYSTSSMTNLRIFGWGTTTGEIVSLNMYKGSATACGTITNAITAATTWNEATLASPLGACTIAAGDLVTFKVKMTAGTNNIARAGAIRFDYSSKF